VTLVHLLIIAIVLAIIVWIVQQMAIPTPFRWIVWAIILIVALISLLPFLGISGI
jgi:hypothetical protein